MEELKKSLKNVNNKGEIKGLMEEFYFQVEEFQKKSWNIEALYVKSQNNATKAYYEYPLFGQFYDHKGQRGFLHFESEKNKIYNFREKYDINSFFNEDGIEKAIEKNIVGDVFQAYIDDSKIILEHFNTIADEIIKTKKQTKSLINSKNNMNINNLFNNNNNMNQAILNGMMMNQNNNMNNNPQNGIMTNLNNNNFNQNMNNNFNQNINGMNYNNNYQNNNFNQNINGMNYNNNYQNNNFNQNMNNNFNQNMNNNFNQNMNNNNGNMMINNQPKNIMSIGNVNNNMNNNSF